MAHVGITRQAGLTRIERARIIRDGVMAQSSAHGRWICHEYGEGRQARVWNVAPGSGWYAEISTRFSLGSEPPPRMEAYNEALFLQLAPPRSYDAVIDLYVEPAGKVLSLGTTGGVDRLITMQPGPWEAMFGLHDRPWTASIARRLGSSQAVGRAS